MIKEQLQMILRGIPNAPKIAEAIINNVKMHYNKLSQEEQDEISKRRAICESCPFMSTNLLKDDSEYHTLTGKRFETSRIGSKFCGFCGCNIQTRTAGLSSNCGIESWNNDNPNKQIELKWNKLNK